MNDVLIRMIQHHPHCNCTGRVCGYACLEQRELAKMLYLCRLSPSFSYLHVYADGKLRHSAESGLKMVNKKGRARSTNFSCPFSPPSLCSPRGLGWVRFRISVDWDHFRDFLSKYINPCSPDPIPSNVSEAKIVRTQVRYGFAQLA